MFIEIGELLFEAEKTCSVSTGSFLFINDMPLLDRVPAPPSASPAAAGEQAANPAGKDQQAAEEGAHLIRREPSADLQTGQQDRPSYQVA